MSAFGAVQNQRFVTGEMMGEALKEVPSLRARAAVKNLPKAGITNKLNSPKPHGQ